MDPNAPALSPTAPAPQTDSDVLFNIFAAIFAAYLVALESHWNVTGPHFFELHRFFRKEYERLFGALDKVAELRRALGERIDIDFETEAIPPASVPTTPSAEGMAESLKGELERIEAEFLMGRPLLSMTDQAILDQISEGNRSAIWMIRSFLDALPSSK